MFTSALKCSGGQPYCTHCPLLSRSYYSQCEIVLVYVKDGIYGELEWIRGPATKLTQHVDPSTQQPEDSNTEAKSTPGVSNLLHAENNANAVLNTNLDITGSALTETTKNSEKIVTTESTVSTLSIDGPLITRKQVVLYLRMMHPMKTHPLNHRLSKPLVVQKHPCRGLMCS